MTKPVTRRTVADPSGGEWTWYLRSDGRYQVNSVEVPTYGFAMTLGALRESCSESMRAVCADIEQTIVLAEHRPITLPQGGDESGTVVTVTEDGSTVVRPV